MMQVALKRYKQRADGDLMGMYDLSLQGRPDVVQCFGQSIIELFLSGSMLSLGLLVQWMYEVAIALDKET